MELKPEIIGRLEKLEEKYDAMGQDLSSYLDGLLYADYLTYWDYIHLDTLLSLQNTRTNFPDEHIFIMYHQITELYFKMILHELDQLAKQKPLMVDFFIARVTRVNRYFENLTQSFAIMVDGMEHQQFIKFRMSLLPASGFQSAQYRMIEIHCTEFIRLVSKDLQGKFAGDKKYAFKEMFQHLYWQAGATELATGKKTLTLKQFDVKYEEILISLAHHCKDSNLLSLYQSLAIEDRKNDKLKSALRKLDLNVNVDWPLVHYKSAVRYLDKKPEAIAATGGTNWQKYLPPRFQKRIFFRELWTDEEMANWGKTWVDGVISGN